MGAWIETPASPDDLTLSESHPMWVRGLKLLVLNVSNIYGRVAPHVGAWIETCDF